MPDCVKTAPQTEIIEICNLKRMLSVFVAKGTKFFDLNWSICFCFVSKTIGIVWSISILTQNTWKFQSETHVIVFKDNSETFSLKWQKSVFSQKNHQNVWKFFRFNTKSTVQRSKTFRCVHFQLVKVFLCKKISVFLGCANRNEWSSPDLRRFWSNSGTNPLAYGLACEQSCETCEHPCEQKTLKKQVVRTSCEHARNVRTSVRTENLEKTGTLGRNCKKICPKLCIFKFLTDNRTGLLKKT